MSKQPSNRIWKVTIRSVQQSGWALVGFRRDPQFEVPWPKEIWSDKQMSWDYQPGCQHNMCLVQSPHACKHILHLCFDHYNLPGCGLCFDLLSYVLKLTPEVGNDDKMGYLKAQQSRVFRSLSLTYNLNLKARGVGSHCHLSQMCHIMPGLTCIPCSHLKSLKCCNDTEFRNVEERWMKAWHHWDKVLYLLTKPDMIQPEDRRHCWASIQISCSQCFCDLFWVWFPLEIFYSGLSFHHTTDIYDARVDKLIKLLTWCFVTVLCRVTYMYGAP